MIDVSTQALHHFCRKSEDQFEFLLQPTLNFITKDFFLGCHFPTFSHCIIIWGQTGTGTDTSAILPTCQVKRLCLISCYTTFCPKSFDVLCPKLIWSSLPDTHLSLVVSYLKTRAVKDFECFSWDRYFPLESEVYTSDNADVLHLEYYAWSCLFVSLLCCGLWKWDMGFPPGCSFPCSVPPTPPSHRAHTLLCC